MLIGYARVSTHDQTLDLQLDALRKAGCTQTFTDTASGGAVERPGLEEAFSHLRDGDTLVVWRLDRLGRSLRHLDTSNNRSWRAMRAWRRDGRVWRHAGRAGSADVAAARLIAEAAKEVSQPDTRTVRRRA